MMKIKQEAKNINKFIITFLERVGVDVTLWSCDENMKEFNALFKKTKLKDKNKPKRPCSAYIFFCKEKRTSVKASLPQCTKNTEVTARLGQMWRALKEHIDSKKLLAPYEELASIDRQRYNQEMDSYVPISDKEIKDQLLEMKPKRVRSAYLFFCDDHRSEVTIKLNGPKSSAVTCELGRMWKEFKKTASNKEMSKYISMHQEDKIRFDIERKKYDDTTKQHLTFITPCMSKKEDEKNIKKNIKHVSKSKKEDEKNIKKNIQPISKSKKEEEKNIQPISKSKKEDEKNIQPISKSIKTAAYRMYVKTTRSSTKETNPHLSARQITSLISKTWRELSDDIKSEWYKKC